MQPFDPTALLAPILNYVLAIALRIDPVYFA
jgi:hypothetical protein